MYPLQVGVTMSIHKLTAGARYDYLTRQVDALDATEKGHTGLASYYTERGETPGVWIGSGLDGIDGLTAYVHSPLRHTPNAQPTGRQPTLRRRAHTVRVALRILAT
jgi:hypothetical protein